MGLNPLKNGVVFRQAMVKKIEESFGLNPLKNGVVFRLAALDTQKRLKSQSPEERGGLPTPGPRRQQERPRLNPLKNGVVFRRCGGLQVVRIRSRLNPLKNGVVFRHEVVVQLQACQAVSIP